MLNIIRIQAENFAQYRTLDFKLSDGVWTISGANRVGKSTIFEALYWCLYGLTARGMKTVRRRGMKEGEECRVGVTINRNGAVAFIQRQQMKSGSKSSIHVNQKDMDSGNLAINQKMIDDFLGINAQFFLGATLFGNKSFRFTQAKDSERKQLFESALSLDRFVNTASFVRSQASIARRQIDEVNGSIETAQQSLTNMTEQLDTKKQDILKELTTSFAEKMDLYDEKKQRLKELKKTLDDVDVDQYDRENTEAMAHLARVITQRGSIERSLRKFDELAVCPECHQVVTASHKKAIRDKLLKQGGELREEEKQVRKRMQKLDTLEVQVRNVNNITDELDTLKEEVSTITERIKSVKSSKDDSLVMMDKMRKQTKAQIANLKKQKEKLDVSLYGYSFWEIGFGRQGIISLLIDEAIEELNEHTVEASAGLTDGLLSVIFDSTTMLKSTSGTSDKIAMHCTVNGEVSDYMNMSQSEQQRIDLCGMFGWHRMISSRVEPVNVMFFDEVFDGMDADTTSMVYEYVRKLGADRPVYVISHAEHLKKRADGVINVNWTAKSGSQIQVKE